MELEELLLAPDVRKSKRLVELLADDFAEFGSSGRVYTKDDLVAVLQAEIVRRANDLGLQSHCLGAGCRPTHLQDPPALAAACRHTSFLGLAEVKRQVADGVSPGNRYVRNIGRQQSAPTALRG
jgi:hypothetical protein